MQEKTLCIALDVSEPFSQNAVDLIRETKDYAAYYKVSPAILRFNTMRRVIDHIRKLTEAKIILDAKYGDVYHINQRYAEYAYEILDVDSVTLNPFVGLTQLSPFFAYPGKKSFVWLASSANSTDLVSPEIVRRHFPSGGMIVGALHLGLLDEVTTYGVPILVPGLGPQGGYLQDIAGYPNVIPVLGRTIINAEHREEVLAEAEEIIWRAKDRHNVKRYDI